MAKRLNQHDSQFGGNEWLHMGRGWNIERLLGGLAVRLAQAWLLRVHSDGPNHFGVAGARYQGCLPHFSAWAHVRRHCQLREQQAEERDERGQKARWAEYFHATQLYTSSTAGRFCLPQKINYA